MTFCEYIERICGEPLDDYQKNLFQQMEENLRNGCQLYMPPKLGRKYMAYSRIGGLVAEE